MSNKDKFFDFILNFEGELTIKGSKAYHNNVLVYEIK